MRPQDNTCRNRTCRTSPGTSCSRPWIPAGETTSHAETTLSPYSIWWSISTMTTTFHGAISKALSSKWLSKDCNCESPNNFSTWFPVWLHHLTVLGCLEECLKYVLLLAFDEEPKYDYLISELQKAYQYCAADAGEKPNPSIFKNPIFDWNVCCNHFVMLVGVACHQIAESPHRNGQPVELRRGQVPTAWIYA